MLLFRQSEPDHLQTTSDWLKPVGFLHMCQAQRKRDEHVRSADGTLLQASGWICQVASDLNQMKRIVQSPVHTHTHRVRSDLRHVFLLLLALPPLLLETFISFVSFHCYFSSFSRSAQSFTPKPFCVQNSTNTHNNSRRCELCVCVCRESYCPSLFSSAVIRVRRRAGTIPR